MSHNHPAGLGIAGTVGLLGREAGAALLVESAYPGVDSSLGFGSHMWSGRSIQYSCHFRSGMFDALTIPEYVLTVKSGPRVLRRFHSSFPFPEVSSDWLD